MSVVVLHDSYTDGGYRDRGEEKCVLRAGSLGEIVDVGQVVETGEPICLFDGLWSAAGRAKLFLHQCDNRARRRLGRVTVYVSPRRHFSHAASVATFARAVFKTMCVRTAQIS
ncbi:hypothetical protein VSR68_42330 [Paraburkholderia phymatum]|uniref:hypothetical protein n=1 Tax=Paraburkholderia TaxID=1822464 RepID=UPI00316F6071